jgi:hypothetical protein
MAVPASVEEPSGAPESGRSASMRVLLLPLNLASQGSVTVRALRALGVDARCLVLNNAVIQDPRGIEGFEISSPARHPLRGGLQALSWWRAVLGGLRWADVVHWQSTPCWLPFDFDLRYVAHLKRARIVEFWGSDIRVPEIASADNPYMASLYGEHPELADGRSERSLRTQRKFADHGFSCLVGDADMESYVRKDLFPAPYRVPARVLPEEFVPCYPNPDETCPTVVHVPSHKVLKGTEHILRAIDELQRESRFNFRLIHGVEHAEALRLVSTCDIMVDEVISGAYGLAAIEAMAMGKPAVCYIKPSLRSSCPSELPIVSANQDDLVSVLGALLRDGERRHQVGRLGRAYVEKYHNGHLIAGRLVSIYRTLLRDG